MRRRGSERSREPSPARIWTAIRHTGVCVIRVSLETTDFPGWQEHVSRETLLAGSLLGPGGKGSSRKERPCQDDRFGKNSGCIIDRGAQYKVYELLSARACDFLVAVGSHAPDTDSSRASSPSRHFVARTRMGLRGGVRARIDTVSTTVHRSLDAVARKKSRVLKSLDADRLTSEKAVAVLSTHVPLDALRLLGFACGLHGDMRTACVHVPVKTAMKTDQTPSAEGYTRTIASGPRQGVEISFYRTP